MELKSTLLSMEDLKDLVLEEDGKCSTIFQDGGEKDSKLAQLIFTTVDGEKLK